MENQAREFWIHTGQDEQDSSTQTHPTFDLLGGPAEPGALEAQHRDQDGDQANQEGQDHQSPADLQVNWEPVHRWNTSSGEITWTKDLTTGSRNSFRTRDACFWPLDG